MTKTRVDELGWDHRFQYQNTIYQRHQGEEPSDHKIRCDCLGLVVPTGFYFQYDHIRTEDFQPDTVVQLVKLTVAPI